MKNVTLNRVGQEITFSTKIQNSVSNFLNSENTLFSVMLEERVSNRKALQVSNVALSTISILTIGAMQMSLLWLNLAWLAVAVYQLAKGGK